MVKAFEKWLKEKGYGSLRDNHDNSCDNGFIMGTEAGWRAALEEALKQINESNSDGSIVDWIKKELES